MLLTSFTFGTRQSSESANFTGNPEAWTPAVETFLRDDAGVAPPLGHAR